MDNCLSLGTHKANRDLHQIYFSASDLIQCKHQKITLLVIIASFTFRIFLCVSDKYFSSILDALLLPS